MIMEYSLLIKRIKKGLNLEEEKEFQQWYSSSEDHRQYYQKLKKDDHNSDAININTSGAWKKVESKTVKNNTPYWKYTVAAILVIGFLSFPAYYFLNNPFEQENQIVDVQEVEKKSEDIIFEDQNGTSIAFGNNDSVVAGKYYQGSKDQLKIDKTQATSGTNTIIVPTGKQFTVELSDGTKVTLNAKSKLEFPSSFDQKDKREVVLVYGEAYFEVTPALQNAGKRFVVKNSNQDIEVVGTSFNIENYNEGKIVTTLVEGEVNLLYGKKAVTLNPGQQSIIENNSLEGIKEVNVYDYIAWKDGMFLFKDESLKDIFEVLSRWYDIKADFQIKELEEMKFNGRFRKEQNLESILDIIENTKRARFELNGNKIKVMQYQE
ncbi:FecR family protein [Christiangramia forsetii KT0803]|uniref:FecR family protein n=2 Tax=Christiangramia forsetii TaxID=411153 RepID=A0M259_CHRFK|nr:FecR family protein [Christiangramia forsetii KT0803]